jgi:hypothetical protein
MHAGEMEVAKLWRRLILASVLLIGATGVAGLDPASAWIESSATGQRGERKMIDSSTQAGVICRNDLSSFPGSVVIEAHDVLTKPVAGYPTQTMSVQYQLYQELPGGTLDFLTQSPIERHQAELSGWAGFGPYTFSARALGPRYVVIVEMIWYDASGSVSGRVRARVSNYEERTTLATGDIPAGRIWPSCSSPSAARPAATLGTVQGTVQSTIRYSLRYYPAEIAIPVTWDGKRVATVTTTDRGEAAGTLAVPAAPMGAHRLQWTAGNWQSTATFTIVPRIKLIPNTMSRGQIVNVSLRGYAAREVVRVRWKKGTSWVEVARVTTSSTGSANINIKVPSWALNGPAAVRGDGSYGRAQTNAVTVSGGPMSASTVKTTTPSPTATATPTPEPTFTSTPSATIEATVAMPSETPTPTVPSDASPVPLAP